MVVNPSTSPSSQTINGVGGVKTGFGSTVRVKFILEIKHKQPIVKNSYTFKKFIPPGFSMLSIPFSHGQNTVNDIFGASPDFVIYEYTFTKNFFEGEWVINAYDSDFEEWGFEVVSTR